MEQEEDRKRVETSSEDTRRRILPDASSPRRDESHAASDGEVLQLFE
jgi:hypothetical protein